jgi:hypothetical protein
VIGHFNQRAAGEEILDRRIPLLDTPVAQVSLDAVAGVPGQTRGLAQRIIHGEHRQRVLRIGRTRRDAADLSEGLLKRQLAVGVDDIRRVEDPVARAERHALAGAPRESEPRREVCVISLDEASRITVLPGKHLLAGRQIETRNPIVTLHGTAEVFPPQPDIRRDARGQSPVVLHIGAELGVREPRRKGRRLDVITRRVTEKQVGQRIEA